MIKAVLFDIGGTLHTVNNNEGLRRAFARRLMDRLAVYGIIVNEDEGVFAQRLHENAEEYKHWSEGSLAELPAPRIWNEYYLKDYSIGEEKLAEIAEELSFLYDYERVCNKRRPGLVQTLEALAEAGVRMGIISNIISTSFGPHIVREYGIEKFMECIVMSSVTGCRKPGAEIFNIAMAKMGLSKEETAYVGDTVSRDVLGAKNAGLAMMIQIDNPAIAHRDAAFGAGAPEPDFRIRSLCEIPSIINEYNNKN